MFDIHCSFQSLDGGHGKLCSVPGGALDKYLHSLSFIVHVEFASVTIKKRPK